MKDLISRLSIALLTLQSSVAWARIGGGGGFSGGGGSGGGSSGGGSSSGGGYGGDGGEAELIIFLVRLVIELILVYPPVTVPAFLVICFVIYKLYRNRGPSVWDEYPDLADGDNWQVVVKSRREQQQKALNTLQSRDPDFDPEGFKRRVHDAFIKAQRAWSDGDLNSLRPMLSAGVYERFDILHKIHQQRRIRNVMQDVTVSSLRITEIRSGPHFDTVNVEIGASAVDFYVHLDDPDRAVGSMAPQRFVEHWAFIRRPGAKSLNKPGLLEGNCPSCGAGIKITDTGSCEYCQVVVSSGEYDWILSEITQRYLPSGNPYFKDLEDFQEGDPAFNLQYLEDRVSVMFWRLRGAEFFGDRSYVSHMVSDRYLKKFNSWISQKPSTGRKVHADAAVGAVEAFHLTHDRNFDYISVRVKWSAHLETWTLPGFYPPAYQKSRLMDEEYVLRRSRQAMTPMGQGLGSNNCSNCGGPESRDGSPRCQYCGEIQNDGVRGWVLHDVRRFSGYVKSTKWRRRRVQVADPAAALVAAAALLHKRRGLSQADRSELQAFADARRLPRNAVDVALNSLRGSVGKPYRPRHNRHKRALLASLLKYAAEDGHICLAEERLFLHLCRVAKIDMEDELHSMKRQLADG